MLASNMTKVYNLINNEMTSLRSEFGSQVGTMQMSINNIGSKYDLFSEKINSRLNAIERVANFLNMSNFWLTDLQSIIDIILSKK